MINSIQSIPLTVLFNTMTFVFIGIGKEKIITHINRKSDIVNKIKPCCNRYSKLSNNS